MSEKKASNFQDWLDEIKEIETEICSTDNPDCEACGS